MLNEKNMSVSPKEGEETVIPAEFIITLEIASILCLSELLTYIFFLIEYDSFGRE